MRSLFFAAVLLLLSACTAGLDGGPSLADLGDHFCQAMRWQDYLGASSHLKEELRADFLDRFQEDEDLRIVESGFHRIELSADAEVAEVEYRMQYYRLPSLTVKKWRWQQRWQLVQKSGLKTGVWQIVNAPPEMP